MNTDSVYVLDACALIALFNNEQGADIVEGLLDACDANEITIRMSTIQVLEVYYDRIYKGGQELADRFLATLYDSSIIVDYNIAEPEIIKASHYKTTYSISLADSICLAHASLYAATVITSDWAEFEPVQQAEGFPFLWIRPKPEPRHK
jgi:PIN domain nuclease of toxin-antitoxin system